MAVVLLALDCGAKSATPAPVHCGIESAGEIHGLLTTGFEPVPTLGIQKLLFLRIRYPDDVADPISLDDAMTTLAEADAAFRRMSYGQFGLTSTVSSVIRLSNPRSSYDSPGGFDRLVDDARQAGIQSGFDYRDYDLEIVRHTGVPSFAGGNARLGARGAQVQANGALILLHEIGHNLGLSHANSWDTSGPGISLGSPPLPSNYPSLPDPRTIPIHPDSVIGHETVTGVGTAIEYGDTWDIMGGGDRDFSATYKRYLGWLPEESVTNGPPGISRHRIYELEGPASAQGRIRSVVVPGPRSGPAGERDYSIELPGSRFGLAPEHGLLVRWIDPTPAHSTSLVLDGTPGSVAVNGDAVLPLGRTFSDRSSEVHITGIARGREGVLRWADVIIARGRFESNTAPVVQLSADTMTATPGTPIQFLATASDADGDELAWYWEFSDRSPTTNSPAITRSFAETGDYVVRVEVSDMKGGTAGAHVVIRVGQPATFRVSGHVRDPDGNPVAGVRVHNGIEGNGRPSRQLVQTFTDSRGAYTLAPLEPGLCRISAFHPGYVMERRSPVDVGSSDVEGVDLIATPLVQVGVKAPAEISEAIGFTNLFTFTRTGPVDQPLTVLFRFGGTASSSQDYVRPLLDRLTIPAGSREATLGFPVIDDSQGETNETVVVSVVETVRFDRIDDSGQPFSVYYPGWEILEMEGTHYWTRTRPDYVPADRAEAQIVIVDDDEFTSQSVSISASDIIALEDPLVDGVFVLTRTGDLTAGLVVRLEISGSATPEMDFEPIPAQIEFAPGGESELILVHPVADETDEPAENLVVRILPDTAYGVGLGEAEVTILDRLVFPQDLSITARSDGQLQIITRGRPGSRLVLEATTDLENWVPVRTNFLFNTDSASVLVPKLPDARFFRTQRSQQ